jgi:hypothetical protein
LVGCRRPHEPLTSFYVPHSNTKAPKTTRQHSTMTIQTELYSPAIVGGCQESPLLASPICTSDPNDDKATQETGICCFYLKYGTCQPPRPPCRFRHQVDDGVVPCCFGATCRNGHKKRFLPFQTMTHEEKGDYWAQRNAASDNLVGGRPSDRDATLLRSQLEPWPTSNLRTRLAHEFGEDHAGLDLVPRGEIMRRLLHHYETRPRTMIRVSGTPVDPALCDLLLQELRAWSDEHKINTRPSIHAESYMILRSPLEFAPPNKTITTTNNTTTGECSRKARVAAKKLRHYQRLWDLATQAMESVDPDYAKAFSALAVTQSFVGSPHIDKQNTGPFYGLAVGDFDDGTGGVCVEVDAHTVAHVNTKSRLGKVDGRYPHWVAPYDSTRERYSLIFYITWQDYLKPGPAYFGPVVVEDEEEKEGTVK